MPPGGDDFAVDAAPTSTLGRITELLPILILIVGGSLAVWSWYGLRDGDRSPFGLEKDEFQQYATDKGMRAVFGSSGSFHGTPLRAFARPWEWGGPREKVETYLSRQRTTTAGRLSTSSNQRHTFA